MTDSPAPAPGRDEAPTAPRGRPRIDPPLSGSFAKDPREEAFLDELNAAVAPMEDAGYRDLEERFPTLHIVGAPRSGTTLLYQAIAARLDVGYIDNLTAAFWRAPVTGLRLARKVGVEPGSGFGSRFGRTTGVGEPHEFGYFWNHHLRYPDLHERGAAHEATIDWPRLRRVIVNMAEARRAAMVFKPMLLIWHMEAMAAAMPRTRFVWIRRDPREVARSLLRMRLAVRGSIDEWASVVPAGAREETDPYRQVAAQALLLDAAIAGAAVRLGPEGVLALEYSRLCARPEEAIADVRELLRRAGHAPALRGEPLPSFTPGPSRGLEEHGRRVDAALDEMAARGGRDDARGARSEAHA
jgi:hypothetical protein